MLRERIIRNIKINQDAISAAIGLLSLGLLRSSQVFLIAFSDNTLSVQRITGWE